MRSREIAKIRWKGAAGTQRSDVEACSPSAAWAAAAEGKCSRKEMDIALLTPAAAFPPRANTMTQSPQQQLDGLTTEIKPQFLQVPKVILGHFALTMQHLESVNSIQSSQRPQWHKGHFVDCQRYLGTVSRFGNKEKNKTIASLGTLTHNSNSSSHSNIKEKWPSLSR